MNDLLYRAISLKRNMSLEDYRTPPKAIAQLNEEPDSLLSVDKPGFHAKEQAFLKYPNVPPDNNASERAIRNVKVKTKVSGAFRNKDGKVAARFAKLRSIIDTAVKNQQNVFGALTKLAGCNIVAAENTSRAVTKKALPLPSNLMS
ncbi:MAG: transposase [Prevotellaceae bacterium]|jgi:hypothetical protein|nr:transposase [Prevotellaceae bacterium]